MRHHRRRKLYLDKENAKISGVCAGIADYFDWDVTVVRVIWVAATILTGFWPLIVGYAVAAWMVDAKPRGLGYHDDGGYADARAEIDESRRAAYHRQARTWQFSDVKNRFDRVEDRLRTLEQCVTSREFQMDRELRGLGRV
ncbi:MAG: envelope stress response membrane protein PspC [Rhodospirillaceae bacterium]